MSRNLTKTGLKVLQKSHINDKINHEVNFMIKERLSTEAISFNLGY